MSENPITIQSAEFPLVPELSKSQWAKLLDRITLVSGAKKVVPPLDSKQVRSLRNAAAGRGIGLHIKRIGEAYSLVWFKGKISARDKRYFREWRKVRKKAKKLAEAARKKLEEDNRTPHNWGEV